MTGDAQRWPVALRERSLPQPAAGARRQRPALDEVWPHHSLRGEARWFSDELEALDT